MVWSRMHQIDLLIAKFNSSNNLSIIEGNDEDFIMLVGSKSAQITSFAQSLKRSKIRNITLMLSINRDTVKAQEEFLKDGCKSSVLKLADFF